MLGFVHTAAAQSSVVWTTDASIGASNGAGGQFVYRTNGVAELEVSARKDVRHGVGLEAEVGYDWSIDTNFDLLCVVNTSGGSCLPRFPEIGGPLGLVGVALRPVDVVQLRVDAGMAAYGVGGTRLGAPVTAIDVALSPMSSLAIVVGGRAFVLPNYRGDRLTVTTWRVGLRLQTHR